ncbi:MAG: HAMP domain-containing sensor histidine kinase [Solirubrobacteraceae bacterium]
MARGGSGVGAFGLRARIVGAVLVTTVATLVVAAVALLGPLENSLRNAEKHTLQVEVNKASTASFKFNGDPGLVLDYGIYGIRARPRESRKISDPGRAAYDALLHSESILAQKIGAADVALLGLFDSTGQGKQIVVYPIDSDIAQSDSYKDVAQAFLTNQSSYTIGSIDGSDFVRAAIPFTTVGPASVTRGHASEVTEHWVLAVRKPLDEVSAAVAAVRTAFLYAALAGAALTLLLAIPLAGRLVRRLRNLSQAALILAEGGESLDLTVDRARDEVGDLARAFSIMQDRLRQQEAARRAFVATASHELRTPLTSLDGMLELLDDDLRNGTPDLDDALLLLERARAQSKRLGRLAADLLDLSRIDAQVQLRSEPVELGELSRAVLAEFELGTGEREIAISLDGAGSVWALADPGSIARILRILLDNAVRASPDGAAIAVRLRTGTHASLSVSDHGPGVPVDERELIFERFKRGRDTAGQAGFGLGLAIGRELARRMGGDLVLDRHHDASDRGATFTLRLPAAHAPHEERLAVL